MQSGTVSIQGSSYEVRESDEFVTVVVKRKGNMEFPIQGMLISLAGSASGENQL